MEPDASSLGECMTNLQCRSDTGQNERLQRRSLCTHIQRWRQPLAQVGRVRESARRRRETARRGLRWRFEGEATRGSQGRRPLHANRRWALKRLSRRGSQRRRESIRRVSTTRWSAALSRLEPALVGESRALVGSLAPPPPASDGQTCAGRQRFRRDGNRRAVRAARVAAPSVLGHAGPTPGAEAGWGARTQVPVPTVGRRAPGCKSEWTREHAQYLTEHP
jgi:hypothetical protein